MPGPPIRLSRGLHLDPHRVSESAHRPTDPDGRLAAGVQLDRGTAKDLPEPAGDDRCVMKMAADHRRDGVFDRAPVGYDYAALPVTWMLSTCSTGTVKLPPIAVS